MQLWGRLQITLLCRGTWFKYLWTCPQQLSNAGGPLNPLGFAFPKNLWNTGGVYLSKYSFNFGIKHTTLLPFKRMNGYYFNWIYLPRNVSACFLTYSPEFFQVSSSSQSTEFGLAETEMTTKFQPSMMVNSPSGSSSDLSRSMFGSKCIFPGYKLVTVPRLKSTFLFFRAQRYFNNFFLF